MQKFKLILFFVLLGPNVHAQQCLEIFKVPQVFDSSMELTQNRKVLFKGVEVFRRNNQIGIQQLGDIEFNKWLEIEPFQEGVMNFIGITDEGRVYHLIQWNGRRIARLLSGEKEVENIFLFQKNVLGAMDGTGRVYLYAAGKWNTSPRGDTLKKAAMIWGGLSTAMTIGLYLLVPDAANWNVDMGSLALPLPAAFVSVVTGLQTAFVMLNRYDRLNTFPDGFVPTDIFISSDKNLKVELAGLSESLKEGFSFGSDFNVPDRSGLDPKLPESTTEQIR